MSDSASTPATIADVARLAGVSIATVSRVLNSNTPVIPETAQRVQEAIRELNYVPRAAARGLASRKTNTLGLLVSEIDSDFFPPMMRGIDQAARALGYDLLIQTTMPGPENIRQPTLGEHNTDGLLVFSDSLPESELHRLRQMGLGIVLLHKTAPPGLNIPSVTVENKQGAMLAVEHMIQVHNRRRIAFLRGPEGNEDSYWREKGYVAALEANGIAYDPQLVSYSYYYRDEAYRAILKMIRDGVVFDGVFTGDDDSATGTLTALREAGKRVPEDVSIVGFDDVSFCIHLTPPLTTVHAPTEEVGQRAVRQLVKIIRNEPIEEHITLLPTQLIIRQSCGCASKDI